MNEREFSEYMEQKQFMQHPPQPMSKRLALVVISDLIDNLPPRQETLRSALAVATKAIERSIKSTKAAKRSFVAKRREAKNVA